MARSQRPVSAALVVVVSLAALLVAGRWLQPRLDGPTPAPATTRPAPTTPEPAPTSPTLATTRPAGTSQIRRVVATSSPVDALRSPGSGSGWRWADWFCGSTRDRLG